MRSQQTNVFLIYLVVGMAWSSTTTAQEAGKLPNLVWIVGENFDLDFGCYGAKNVHTPHIDGLATRGVRFTHAFSTSPVCAPSRSAFFTGMYATSVDMHNMRSHRTDDYRLPPGVRPLTHRLQEVGYTTANIQKIGDEVVGTGKLDLNFVNEGPLYSTEDWSTLAEKQPFFAQINMPEAEYDIYDRKSAEKSRVPWVGEEWHPQVATPENVTPPAYYPEHPIVRQEWARYLNSASGMDVRIGKILSSLREQDLMDDTIIIFFADNGRLEARGIHWCFDSGIHVPLIIAWPKDFPAPRGVSAGSVNSQVVSLLDLTATTLAFAGIERPPLMQSRVILGARADPERKYAFSARDRIDETVVRQRSVRDARYHYIRNFTAGAGFSTLNRYKEKCFLVKPLMRKMLREGKLSGPPFDLMQPFPEEMLFDTHADPNEMVNLANSDSGDHQRALIRLRAALATWMVETGDRGGIPEPSTVVAPFTQEMHDWFGTPIWATAP